MQQTFAFCYPTLMPLVIAETFHGVDVLCCTRLRRRRGFPLQKCPSPADRIAPSILAFEAQRATSISALKRAQTKNAHHEADLVCALQMDIQGLVDRRSSGVDRSPGALQRISLAGGKCAHSNGECSGACVKNADTAKAWG
jgi:hypothetical protein